MAIGDPAGGAPARTELVSVAPNPFNPATAIRFAMAERGPALIAVYGVDGRNDGGQPVASGTYVVALRTVAGLDSWKVTLAK